MYKFEREDELKEFKGVLNIKTDIVLPYTDYKEIIDVKLSLDNNEFPNLIFKTPFPNKSIKLLTRKMFKGMPYYKGGYPVLFPLDKEIETILSVEFYDKINKRRMVKHNFCLKFTLNDEKKYSIIKLRFGDPFMLYFGKNDEEIKKAVTFLVSTLTEKPFNGEYIVSHSTYWGLNIDEDNYFTNYQTIKNDYKELSFSFDKENREINYNEILELNSLKTNHLSY